MPTLILRDANSLPSGGATFKGSPLTNNEVDNNFANINLSIGTALSQLTTSNTSNLIFAINEVNANTGVTSNTYGGISTGVAIVVNAKGRITSASNTTIFAGAGSESSNTITVVNDEATNSTFYPVLSTATSGNTASRISTSKLQYNPSTGLLSANSFTSSNTTTVQRISETRVAIGNTGTNPNINLFAGTVFTANLSANATFNVQNPTGAAAFTLILTNDATPGRSVAWTATGGNFVFPGGAASLSRTTTANAIDVWVFFSPNGGTTWFGNITMKNMTA